MAGVAAGAGTAAVLAPIQVQLQLPQQNETKILLLTEAKTADEDLKGLQSSTHAVRFDSASMTRMRLDEVMARNQSLIIDLSDDDQRLWYSQNRSQVATIANLRVVFKLKPGKKSTRDRIASVKLSFLAHFVVKHLPVTWRSDADYLAKMLVDHLPKNASWTEWICSCFQ